MLETVRVTVRFVSTSKPSPNALLNFCPSVRPAASTLVPLTLSLTPSPMSFDRPVVIARILTKGGAYDIRH